LTTISSSDSPFSITLDAKTGLPNAIQMKDNSGQISASLRMSVTAEIGGQERRHPTGGLLYENTEFLSDPVASRIISRIHKGTYDEYHQKAKLGSLNLTLHYRLYPTAPYFEISATFAADASVLVRNVVVEVETEPMPNAVLNTPGNLLRRNLPMSEFGDRPLGIATLGGLRGSSGVIGATQNDSTLVIWPNQPTEIPDVTVSQANSKLQVRALLNFAAEVSQASAAEVVLMTFNLERGGFELVKEHWPSWASRYGLTSPNDPPSWMHGAAIYEVQIGTSYFWKNNAYCRYAEIRDLTADLDRISEMGFSVIQLMPRQPYPSYNVHDYADVTTSYGDEAELRELVEKCHRRGMRVILDVLLHGVLDNESIDSAAQGVIDGPLYSKLNDEVNDTLAGDLTDDDNYWIAWSRHILDFSEYWRGGSPKRTPLQETNPEWFATDSHGNVSGVYTKAFDARNPSWQLYFRESMMNLIRNYDVDGFRFDAPTYNLFANWAPWARARAFLSPLGCVPLFVDMRNDMRSEKPDSLLYTEPSGHLLRRSMDVNYNYDEQWLVSALMAGNHKQRAVRNGRDFMLWIQDRDDFLPVGSHTAHHIDSHDTFWWPQWGKKWRREQYSIDAVKALAASFLALDGPYMMFTGGEEGIESDLSELLNFRKTHQAQWATAGHFDTESDPTGNLIIVSRQAAGLQVVTIVNTSATDSVAIPDTYASWSKGPSNGRTENQLEPFGYLMAER
jgi:glycosidase